MYLRSFSLSGKLSSLFCCCQNWVILENSGNQLSFLNLCGVSCTCYNFCRRFRSKIGKFWHAHPKNWYFLAWKILYFGHFTKMRFQPFLLTLEIYIIWNTNRKLGILVRMSGESAPYNEPFSRYWIFLIQPF